MREAKNIRDNIIKDLEEKLKLYTQNIANLQTEILQLKGRVFEAPQVHRVAEIEKMQVIYQTDPNVLERNKDLGDEIEYLTMENQKLNLQLGNSKKNYDLLLSRYEELDILYKQHPRTIYVPKLVEEVR